MGEKNPIAYAQGAKRAREARSNVAAQLAALIESADLTGSHPFVAKRVMGYSQAVKAHDPLLIRAALMDLAAAAGATAAAIDLCSPQTRQAA
jgi:hypothetical protein